VSLGRWFGGVSKKAEDWKKLIGKSEKLRLKEVCGKIRSWEIVAKIRGEELKPKRNKR
jgi:hypothetical protein